VRWLWIVLWTYLVFVLHAGFARELQIGKCTPHLALAGLIPLAVRASGRRGIVVAAVWGLLSDCLSDGRLGTDVIVFVLAACCTRRAGARWNLIAPWRTGVFSAVTAWGALVACASLRLLSAGGSPPFTALGLQAAGSAVYTGLLAALVALTARIVWRSTDGDESAPAPQVSNKWRMLSG